MQSHVQLGIFIDKAFNTFNAPLAVLFGLTFSVASYLVKIYWIGARGPVVKSASLIYNHLSSASGFLRYLPFMTRNKTVMGDKEPLKF